MSFSDRCRHLFKTYWGWREQQLPDGTLILTSPAGDTHVTTPGSALSRPSDVIASSSLGGPVALEESRST
jgi:hypothetical protein